MQPTKYQRLNLAATRRALAEGAVLVYEPTPHRWWIERDGVYQYAVAQETYLALLDSLIWLGRRGPFPFGRYYYSLESESAASSRRARASRRAFSTRSR